MSAKNAVATNDEAEVVLSRTQTSDAKVTLACWARGGGFELLGKRGDWVAGVPCLSFAHHGNHLDTGQDCRGADGRLESEHGPNAALEAPMTLLDAVVQILAPADADRLQPVTGSIRQPALAVTGRDGLPVCPAGVDDNPWASRGAGAFRG